MLQQRQNLVMMSREQIFSKSKTIEILSSIVTLTRDNVQALTYHYDRAQYDEVLQKMDFKDIANSFLPTKRVRS